MVKKAGEDTIDIPSLGISVKSMVNGTMEVVFQTFVERDAPVEEINKLVDKCIGVAERQDNKFKLQAYREQLQTHEHQLANMKVDIQAIDERVNDEWAASGRKGPFQRSQKQEQERKHAIQVQARFLSEIEKLKRMIAELEPKVK
jgi:uncharacterized protein (DUF342 family)